MTLASVLEQMERTQPVFNEARCVHDHLAGARCQACADACPAGALALGEDALELDADACTGCMLCAAACPQEAIDFGKGSLATIVLRKGATAYLTCARSGVGTARQSLPCVHALSWRDLLRLYASGTRVVAVAFSECQGCDAPLPVRLERTIGHVNELLRSRALHGLQLRTVSKMQWKTELPGAAKEIAASPQRRAFLRRMVDPRREKRASEATATVAAMLGRSAPKSAIFAAVPVIDAQRCDGCDACVRVCPTGALSLAEDAGLHYRVDASRCTGCGLCTDVCQPDAISVQHWTTTRQQRITLMSGRCPACGVDYHAPTARPDGLCTICAKTSHHRKLFQVDPV